MGWSRTRREEGEFFIDYIFDGEDFYLSDDDNAVDEVKVESFVDEKVAEIMNFGDMEYLDYEFSDDIIIHFVEHAVVTITEYDRYQPMDVDYELDGEQTPSGCKEVKVVTYTIK